MKRTQLVVLILILVVVGIAAWLLAKRSTTSWQSSTSHLPEKVVSLPINDVAQISIQQPDKQVNLTKKGDTWVVPEKSNYPANFEMISGLIRKVWELKPVQEVKVGESQLGRLSMLPPGHGSESGTLVEFKNASGQRLAALTVGKKYMRESNQPAAPGRSFPAGRYVMAENGSHQVMLVSDPLMQIDDKPEQWLDRTFLKIEKPTLVQIAGATPEISWKLERVGDSKEWKLVDAKPGEQLDSAKANQITSAVNSIASFTDVLPPDSKPESTGLDKPTTITINTEEGFHYVLEVGHKTNESYPVKVSVSANLAATRTPSKDEKPDQKAKLDKEFQEKKETLEKKLANEKKLEGRVYLVPKFGIDMLEKNRADLMATPTPSPTPATSPAAARLPRNIPPRGGSPQHP
jgi:hypothetical protein